MALDGEHSVSPLVNRNPDVRVGFVVRRCWCFGNPVWNCATVQSCHFVSFGTSVVN